MKPFKLKSTQFRAERQASWRELEKLVARAEKEGLRNLGPEELRRLPVLYRGAVSSLSVARAISLDKNLLEYLSSLTCRAYIVVYSCKSKPRDTLVEFFTRRLPDVFRRYVGYVAAAILLMALGVVCGYVLTTLDPERYYSFVPEAMADGRNPGASTEELREVLYDEHTGVETLQAFASFLFTHNATVGLLCFSLGFAAGAPVVFLLFYNGLLLGAMAALYASRGLGAEFWAWVLPHGVPELLAVCLCGAAGLVFGAAVLFPGPYRRLENLAARGRDVSQVVIGAIVLLFIAALLEGFFRQLVHSVPVRWTVAATGFVLLSAYFGLVGRRARA